MKFTMPLFAENCYGVFKESVDFYTAQKRCRQSGADLASVSNIWENAHLGYKGGTVVGWGK